jgi:hypothetical protein
MGPTLAASLFAFFGGPQVIALVGIMRSPRAVARRPRDRRAHGDRREPGGRAADDSRRPRHTLGGITVGGFSASVPVG